MYNMISILYVYMSFKHIYIYYIVLSLRIKSIKSTLGLLCWAPRSGGAEGLRLRQQAEDAVGRHAAERLQRQRQQQRHDLAEEVAPQAARGQPDRLLPGHHELFLIGENM